jgi:hypothetical protein
MSSSAMVTNIRLELCNMKVSLHYKHGAFKKKEYTLDQWANVEQVENRLFYCLLRSSEYNSPNITISLSMDSLTFYSPLNIVGELTL